MINKNNLKIGDVLIVKQYFTYGDPADQWKELRINEGIIFIIVDIKMSYGDSPIFTLLCFDRVITWFPGWQNIGIYFDYADATKNVNV